MTFPLQELTRLIAPDATLIGAVVGFNGNLVRVATERGAVTARSLDVLALGDRVLVRHGMATRAPDARHIYPV
jgi:hypothetical protein